MGSNPIQPGYAVDRHSGLGRRAISVFVMGGSRGLRKTLAMSLSTTDRYRGPPPTCRKSPYLSYLSGH
jgi:hypothetical protein